MLHWGWWGSNQETHKEMAGGLQNEISKSLERTQTEVEVLDIEMHKEVDRKDRTGRAAWGRNYLCVYGIMNKPLNTMSTMNVLTSWCIICISKLSYIMRKNFC